MSRTRDVRARWVPLIKIALTSGADIYGDWKFYHSIATQETDQDIVDTYKLPIFIFFIVACVMGGLTIFSLLCKGCCPGTALLKTGEKPGFFAGVVKYINRILFLEMLVEDVPQFVLSTLVTFKRGEMTTSEIINVTTSAYNFVFNILDMLSPEPEIADEEKEPLKDLDDEPQTDIRVSNA